MTANDHEHPITEKEARELLETIDKLAKYQTFSIPPKTVDTPVLSAPVYTTKLSNSTHA